MKRPGQVAGQQFIIEDCDDCDIFVLDHSATVSVDQCKRCLWSRLLLPLHERSKAPDGILRRLLRPR